MPNYLKCGPSPMNPQMIMMITRRNNERTQLFDLVGKKLKLVSWLILSCENQCKCVDCDPVTSCASFASEKKEFSRACICMRCRNTVAFIVNKKTWVI